MENASNLLSYTGEQGSDVVARNYLYCVSSADECRDSGHVIPTIAYVPVYSSTVVFLLIVTALLFSIIGRWSAYKFKTKP
jgi:hypothetical protein